jgi:uncharacterized membrane protein YhaH (DUF805 family)
MALVRTSAKGAKVNFLDSIRYGFKKALDFKGVATRSEFWYFTSFSAIALVLASAADSAIAPVFGALQDPLFSPVELFAAIVLILPQVAVSARRLHDSGKTAKILVAWVTPIVVTVLAAVRFAQLPNLGVSVELVVPTDLLELILVDAFAAVLLLLIFTVLMVLKSKSAANGNRYVEADLPMPQVDDLQSDGKPGVVNIGL